ncbi:ABC-2 type transport system permease protein [Diaminobutyricimonas aerilata]|uniref:ABC-2 type transport system permease protein n=1 Tax=Diaminobutyricimonas aerilata TaxID=1162967 RepID=A0A2M9CNT6_9MICO|nr:ABC transporter permease [Diaminobutyricimonas aerilata]PJJ73570.1 ABC-2 type transport system permease protein [Diaminobutyricimonas aerilata]
MTDTNVGFRQTVALVAGREIRMRLRSKAFVISAGILMLVVLGSIILSSVLSRNASDTSVAVVGAAQEVVTDAPGLDVTEAADVEEAEQLVRDGDVEAAIVPNEESPVGVRIIALDDAPGGVVQALSISPEVELLVTDGPNPLLAYFVAFGFGIVFFMSALTFGSTIAQSVVEEKSTRVVEILMSAISSRALLAGKVLGNSVLAFGQVILIALVAMIGFMVTGQSVIVDGLGPAIAWFVVFFAIGFVLLAALFAASAALVSRQEDIGSVTSPVTTLIMLPYFAVIFFNDNPVVMSVMSYIPFSAPVGMPVRIFLEQAQWWEPLVSLVIMVVTTVVVVIIGSRIYGNSLLRMGGRVKLGEALKS